VTPARACALGQIVLGSIALSAPGWVAGATARSSRPAPAWIVRGLGARMVLQGSLLRRWPSQRALHLGAGIDALHGASMVAVAHRSPDYRRTAHVSAAVAGISALLEWTGQL
jgi:hypothetical protein